MQTILITANLKFTIPLSCFLYGKRREKIRDIFSRLIYVQPWAGTQSSQIASLHSSHIFDGNNEAIHIGSQIPHESIVKIRYFRWFTFS